MLRVDVSFFCLVCAAAIAWLCVPSSAAQAAVSEDQCLAEWDSGNINKGDKAALENFLRLCGKSSKAAEARRLLAKFDRPPPPPFNRCETLWQSASRTGSERDLRIFVDACRAHSKFAEASRRILKIKAAKSCMGNFQRGESYSDVEAYRAFLNECPIDGRRALVQQRVDALVAKNCNNQWAQADASANLEAFEAFARSCPSHVRVTDARSRISTLQSRQKFDSELSRWNLNFQAVCNLSVPQLISRANVQARYDEINKARLAGDSTAELLMGLYALRDFNIDQKISNGVFVGGSFERAARAGNPRAMAELAYRLLDRPYPDAVAADLWIEKSSAMGCGEGLALMGDRLRPENYQDAPRPKWANQIPELFYKRAQAAGHGHSACRLALDYRAKDYTEQDALLKKATDLGDTCGEVFQYDLGADGKGPYANNKVAILAGLRRLADTGDGEASYRLANLLDTPAYGRKENAADYLKYLAIAARSTPAIPNAWLRLANLYFSAEPVGANLSEARKWCQRAFDAGSLGGTTCLGRLETNWSLSRDLFELAIKKGDMDCAPYYAAMRPIPGSDKVTKFYKESDAGYALANQNAQKYSGLKMKALQFAWNTNLRFLEQATATKGTCASSAQTAYPSMLSVVKRRGFYLPPVTGLRVGKTQ